VSDDPDDANDKNWRNGEPDEVETEWELLQTEFANANGVNNKDNAPPEDLPDGDEVVTRRYEFFKYTGPVDEVGEALCDTVGADGIHGDGTDTVNGVEVDFATLEVVGEFTGAQMAAVDVKAVLSLTEQLGEGRVGTAYAPRAVVLGGLLPFTSVRDGALPGGMAFNEVTGILSGTPTAAGNVTFRITASDETHPDITKSYTLRIAAAGAELPPAYLMDTTRDPVDGGTTTGDGPYAPGAAVTVTAVPAPGFRFVSWEDNHDIVSQTTSHSFTADVNHTLTAHFAPQLPQFNITSASSPVTGGSVSGGGVVDEGTQVTLTAIPAAGYQLDHWENAAHATVGTNTSYVFLATQDQTLSAFFIPIPTYGISVAASPSAGGTVTGGGSFLSGNNAAVTATANAGYLFSKWTAGGNAVSSSSTYSFNVSANLALSAVFIAAGQAKTVTLNSNPSAGGSATGAGSYLTGDSVTINATPAPNYIFSRWTESGGGTVSTSPGYTFTLAGNRTLTARFTESIVITATSAFPEAGVVEMDSASYKTGDSADADAQAEAGFVFVHWTENGNIVSTAETYSFNVTGPRALVGHFTYDGGWLVAARSAQPAGGSVMGAGAYHDGDEVTVSAVAVPGYTFLHWKEGAVIVSTDADYHFPAAANRVLTAHFAATEEITALVVPSVGGGVTGTGSYLPGDEVTLIAEPAEGYVFSHWMKNGVVLSTSESFTFSVTTPQTYVAYFVPATNEIHILVRVDPPAAGTAKGGGDFQQGNEVEVEAEAQDGFIFSHWTEATTCVSKQEEFEFAATRSRTLTAHFLTNPGLAMREDDGMDEDPESPHHGEHRWDINWEDHGDGWKLEESTDAANWCDCPQPLVLKNGRRHALLPMNANRGFFRLKRP
jgi:Divergent InlB B-repeat domain/Putative Ig domain